MNFDSNLDHFVLITCTIKFFMFAGNIYNIVKFYISVIKVLPRLTQVNFVQCKKLVFFAVD